MLGIKYFIFSFELKFYCLICVCEALLSPTDLLIIAIGLFFCLLGENGMGSLEFYEILFHVFTFMSWQLVWLANFFQTFLSFLFSFISK